MNAKDVGTAREFKAVLCPSAAFSLLWCDSVWAWLLGSRGISVLWRISDIRRHTPGPTLRAVSTT